MIDQITKDDIKRLSIVTKEEWREFTKTVWQIPNVVHPNHPAVFPEEIPHRLTKLFTFWGEKVLDPFAGVGTTALAAIRLGRDAVIIDQNSDYINIAKSEADRLQDRKGTLVAMVGDSRNMEWIDDETISLVVTSPPYWDKAKYGNNASNLGNISGYLQFVESMRPTFEECYRVLMPGRKLSVVTANVSQHTDAGLLCFPLATDLAILLRDIGFVMINEVIWNKNGTGGRWGSWGNQRPIFGSYPYPPNFLFKTVHEYILIFAKPAEIPKRGPKVKALKDLMGMPETSPGSRLGNGYGGRRSNRDGGRK